MIVGYGSITITSLVDIQSSCWYYMLSSSMPAKPTQNADPPSGWNKTEPSYTTGSNLNLYIVNKIVYGDGTFEYSDVSLSSSYEAAKQANSKIDNLEIGGRNLARGTDDTTGVHWVKSRATEANGILTITPTISAGYGKYIMDYLLYGDNVNQTFTLSFDAREIESASGYGTGVIITYMGVQAPSRIDSILQSAYDRYGRKDLTIKGENWNRYSVSFTFPSDITTGQASAFTDNAIISFELGRTGSTCPLEVKNCKLERGEKATDWTPAPEDVSKYTDDSINAIEIGSRNLILNTLVPSITERPKIKGQIGQSSGRGSASVAEHGIRFTNTAVNWQYIYFGSSSNNADPDMLGLEPDETYTFSCDLSWNILSSDTGKADTTTNYMRALLAYCATETGSFSNASYVNVAEIKQIDKGTNMSARCVYTFTVPSNAVRLYLGIRSDNTTAAHYAIGDWIEARNLKLEKGNKPTDWTPAPEDVDASVQAVNTEITNFITNTYASDKTDIQSQIDGKAETWYQSGDPSTAWTTAELRAEHTGDIWYKTTDGTTWYYDGTQWAQQNVPDSVLDTIDGKAQIFISEPYPPYSEGDLWFNSATADIMTCIHSQESGSYIPSYWEKRNKYTDDTAVNNLEIGGNNLYAVCNQVYGYLNTNGTVHTPTSANCKTSDYIPVSQGEHYIFQAWVPSIGASQQLWIGYVFYSDTSGTIVGGRTAKYATAGEKYLAYTDITVPTGVSYIRVSYRRFEDGCCKLEKGNKPTDWSPAPEDVDSRITGTNLSPFFSYIPYVVGDYWTTWPTGNGYVFTPKGDGWVRIQKDNSTGSSVVRHDIYMTRAEMVKPGSDYTMLFEFRNNNSTGDSADSNVYIVQGTNTQFWGNSIKKMLEGVNSNSASTSLISDFPPGTSGVYRKRFVKTSESANSAHWTGSEAVYLACLTFRCAANSTIDYEVRISLYEGECISPYKPYNIEVGDYATVKTTANNALTTANGKNKVIYSTTQPSGVFMAGDTWFNTSTSGADAGKISKYNGSDWVVQEIGSASILANEALVNKLFAYDITAANCITAPILISPNYNGTIDSTQTRPTYDNNNTAGSIINLYEGKVNIGGKLKYDSTNGLVLDGKLRTSDDIEIYKKTNFTNNRGYLLQEIVTKTDTSTKYLETHINQTAKYDSGNPDEYYLSDSDIYIYSDIEEKKSFLGISHTSQVYGSSSSWQDIILGDYYYEEVSRKGIGILTKNVCQEIIISTTNDSEYETDKISLISSNIDIICNITQDSYTSFSGNVVSSGTVVVVKKIGWCQVFGALRPTSSAANFVTILDSTKVPAPQHGIDIYEQAQYWESGYTTPLRIRINALGGLDICKGYVNGSYGFSITYPIEVQESIMT